MRFAGRTLRNAAGIAGACTRGAGPPAEV